MIPNLNEAELISTSLFPRVHNQHSSSSEKCQNDVTPALTLELLQRNLLALLPSINIRLKAF